MDRFERRRGRYGSAGGADRISAGESRAFVEAATEGKARGALLAGPPGTGKTTIGRALAHRLKAKRNAPSVIFIDDAGVIFDDKRTGLYRYPLTMIDGLEKASLEQVCVMLTAMDATALPGALLRSGRVEL